MLLSQASNLGNLQPFHDFQRGSSPCPGSFILPESSQVPHSSAIFDTIPLINACCLAILSIPGDQQIFPRPQFLILLTLGCSCRALSHVSTLPKAKMSPALHGLLWRKVRTQPGVSIHPKNALCKPTVKEAEASRNCG